MSILYRYYCNDNAANTTVTDELTALNGTSYRNTSVITNTSGKYNRAFTCNGTEGVTADRIVVNSYQACPFSIGGWFYRTAGNAVFFGNGYDYPTNKGYQLRYDGSGMHPMKGGSTFTKTYTMTSSTWYHLVMTVGSTGTIKLYVNGSLLDTFYSAAQTLWTSFSNFGAEYNSSAGWILTLNGREDCLFIANHEMSSTEVSTEYSTTETVSASPTVIDLTTAVLTPVILVASDVTVTPDVISVGLTANSATTPTDTDITTSVVTVSASVIEPNVPITSGNNLGTLVIAPVRPQAVNDTYPTVYANEALGGLHTVQSIVSRDNVTTDRRIEGMLCYVKDDDTIYQLYGGITNDDWRALFYNLKVHDLTLTAIELTPPSGWSERRPIADDDYSWNVVATDSTGATLLVGSGNRISIYASGVAGRLWISSDSGVNWTETRPLGDTDQMWFEADISDDGNIMAVTTDAGRAFISYNKGTNWTEVYPWGSITGELYPMASISIGSSYMVGACRSQGISYSSDNGVSWTLVEGAYTDSPAHLTAISANGSKMYACGFTTNMSGVGIGVVRSSDYGASWTTVYPSGITNSVYVSIACSADGNKIIAGEIDYSVGSSRLWTSTDSGSSWTESRPKGDANVNWCAVDCDSSGSNMLAGEKDGRLYKSTDGGSTWVETQPAGDSNKPWCDIAIDNDGSNIIACCNGARLWTTNEGALETHNPRLRQEGYHDDYDGDFAYVEWELSPTTKWLELLRSQTLIEGVDIKMPLKCTSISGGGA